MPSVFIATPYIICHAQVRVCSRQKPAHTGLHLFFLKKARDFVSGSGNRSPGALHKHRWAGRGTPKAFRSRAAAAPLKHTEALLRPKVAHKNMLFRVSSQKYAERATSPVWMAYSIRRKMQPPSLGDECPDYPQEPGRARR